MLILLERDDMTYAATYVGWLARLRVRIFGFWVDRELADGACVDCAPSLVLRSRVLLSRSNRVHLADGFRRVLAATAPHPARPMYAHPVAAHAPVREATDELTFLIVRLEGPEPIAVRGLAKARVLLNDGAGPLYGGRPGQLRTSVLAVLDALDPYGVPGCGHARRRPPS